MLQNIHMLLLYTNFETLNNHQTHSLEARDLLFCIFCSWVWARLTLRSAQHRHQRNFCNCDVLLKGPLTRMRRKTLIKAPQWARGGPEFFFVHKILFFCDLKLCANFHKPRTTPSGTKVCGTERRKERKENNPKNSRHFVPLQGLRAAHALRLDQ